MQAKSYSFQRQARPAQPPAATTTAPQSTTATTSTTTVAQPADPNNNNNNPPPKPALVMAPLPNNIPPPPQFFTYPPPPPVPIEPTPDLDMFSYYNLYQPLIASNIYREGRIDMDHSLSKALLSDIKGPEIEPELYPDMTNTGVIHQDKVKLTQKVKLSEIPNAKPTTANTHPINQTAEVDLILNPLDQGIERQRLFQSMPQSLKRKTQFNHEGQLHNTNAIQTRPKRAYIAPNVFAQNDYNQDPIQHAAKKAAR